MAGSRQSRPKKNSSAPPGQITLFSAVFPLLIEIFVGWDALAKAKEGPKRKFEGKRESYPTGTWGRNSQSA